LESFRHFVWNVQLENDMMGVERSNWIVINTWKLNNAWASGEMLRHVMCLETAAEDTPKDSTSFPFHMNQQNRLTNPPIICVWQENRRKEKYDDGPQLKNKSCFFYSCLH